MWLNPVSGGWGKRLNSSHYTALEGIDSARHLISYSASNFLCTFPFNPTMQITLSTAVVTLAVLVGTAVGETHTVHLENK